MSLVPLHNVSVFLTSLSFFSPINTYIESIFPFLLLPNSIQSLPSLNLLSKVNSHTLLAMIFSNPTAILFFHCFLIVQLFNTSLLSADPAPFFFTFVILFFDKDLQHFVDAVIVLTFEPLLQVLPCLMWSVPALTLHASSLWHSFSHTCDDGAVSTTGCFPR